MRELQPNLNDADKDVIEKLLSAGDIKHKYAVRLQTILLRHNGKRTNDIADFLGLHRSTVSLYINRYNTRGINSLLQDKTRKPGKAPISRKIKEKICRIVCTEKPQDETHWSIRTLAKRVGISRTAVNTILREYGLKPHLVSKHHYSKDPEFEKKLEDVAGLYMNPPSNAIILCAGEKSQIQALERTQPIVPIMRNVPERQTVEYERHGTTTLFAALDELSGNVIGECKDTHNAKDYVSFLKKVDAACQKEKVLHVIADNLSAHKAKEVTAYLEGVPGRFEMHYIPTHSSWLNLVERWFAEITNKRIRRGSWESVSHLTRAIKEYIKTWNKSGRKFVRTKRADDILLKIGKAKSLNTSTNV
jgi:transposase